MQKGRVIDYDVIIIGAGPAGSSVAFFLSKIFDRILLVDQENKLEHEKLCGGALAHDTLDHLRQYWDIEFPNDIYHGGEIYFKGKQLRTVINTDLQIAMVMRHQLDSLLIQKVRSLGVEVRLQTKVTRIERIDGLYHILMGDEIIKSTILVAADGAPSFVRKQLDLSGQGYYSDLALTYEFHSPSIPDIQLPRLYFGDVTGYRWMFPKQHQTTIGVGGFNQPKELKEYLDWICNKIDIEPEHVRGHWIPFSNVTEKVCVGNCYFVGDAANLFEPISGKGLYYALESGRLLSLALQTDNPNLAYQNYMQDIRNDIAFGLKIVWFLYREHGLHLGCEQYLKSTILHRMS